MRTENDNDIKFVQGDTYEKVITINGVDISIIKSVFITNKDLNIQQNLDYDEEHKNFTFRLSAEQTKEFEEYNGSYDLTVLFRDGKISTVVYNGLFRVLPKKNLVVYEQG